MLQDRALGTNADHWSGVRCGGIAQGSKFTGGKIGGAELVAAEQVDVVVAEW